MLSTTQRERNPTIFNNLHTEIRKSIRLAFAKNVGKVKSQATGLTCVNLA